MKVVLLAGGRGTRISEESNIRPKPMIELGGMPILWHIMKLYSHYGFNEFVICAGYKQQIIKEWFASYFLHMSDITFDFTSGRNELAVHHAHAEPWKVTIVDTGLDTMTGGRIKRVREYVADEPFFMAVKDVVEELLKHTKGKWADKSDPKAVHEAGLLNLDIRKAKKILRWKPRWNFEETVAKTVEWYESVRSGAKAADVTRAQIEAYCG